MARGSRGPCRVFGPVPSRRLGYSLGVDALPFKTCDLDCVYCQLGKTTRKTLERKAYVRAKEILDELSAALKGSRDIDFISFSGSGEPTLNTELGAMIRGAKRLSKVPVAVITNGTLLWQPDVARDLMAADAVLPSLDAASPAAFKKLDRPVPGLPLEKVVQGLVDFRKRYQGKLWLEVMLVKGYNDSLAELRRLKACIDRIRPDRVDINSPVRPSDSRVRPASPAVLARAKVLFGPKAVLIAASSKKARQPGKATAEQVADMIFRRPVTAEDIAHSFGLKAAEVQALLSGLVHSGTIRASRRSGKLFYRGS
ncbi:MAG: radical SAM protein [Elusimicrobia bacterium]|nr:radical SAM protein [Elusimicrobiota bacterium]